MDTPDVWFVNLGIKINTLKPVAFSFFGIDIYWYGIIIGLGILAGFFVVKQHAKATGQNFDIYSNFLIYAILSSIVGARLYYVIWEWDRYKNNILEIFNTRNGGLAVYGGIIAAIAAAFIYTKIKKINLFKFLDTCAFGLIIGQAIGRWGNFFNREAFGKYTDSLFALRYVASQVKNDGSDAIQEVLNNTITYNGIKYIQVHPTFLYESLWNIGLFIIIKLLYKHTKFNGEICAYYFIGYGLGRFWIEGLRTDQLIIGNTGVPVSQALSLFLFLFGLFIVIYNRRRLKQKI